MGCPSIMWSMTDAGDRQDAGMAWVTDGRLSRELDEREAAVCRIRSRHPGWRVWVRPGTGAWCAMPPRGCVWEGSASCLHGWDAESLEVAIGRFEHKEI
jgi:hypothetical protein